MRFAFVATKKETSKEVKVKNCHSKFVFILFYLSSQNSNFQMNFCILGLP